MSDPRFLQDGFDKRLSHFIEECGEALSAAGKTQRWGVWSANPLLPPYQQETNLVWLRRELDDVKQAIRRLEESIALEFTGDDPPASALETGRDQTLATTGHLALHCAHGKRVVDRCEECEKSPRGYVSRLNR